LDERLTQPEIWGDPEQAGKLRKERSRLLAGIGVAERLKTLLDEAETLLELGREGEEVGRELGAAVQTLAKQVEETELDTLLTGEYDATDAILEVHPGAGGTESQDWAQMLFRMYTRWAESRGYGADVLDWQDGDEAGIKSATLSIRGPNAYGYLKGERGVHRLVRISPYDAQGRRHTSFASVEILPDVEDDLTVEIDDKDLRVDTYRSSGAGGQHVNKTESAIRITHVPSGIVVACQNERSQHRNRDLAMKILRAKLFTLAQQEADEKRAREVGVKKKIEWGSQIRSYVLAPYRLVKDHRTSHEVGAADRVLDGDLDGFLRATLLAQRDEGTEVRS
jgi:peptide chain release factor 2